ncbi:MAG: DNA internalization-related competence protein ComEC/Rec2 [Actinomycetota bacterium]
MSVRAAPVATAGLWAGILAADRARGAAPWQAWLVVGLVALAVSAFGRGAAARSALALALATFLVGAGWGGLALARLAASPLATPGAATIVGTLRTDPSVREYGWSAILGVDGLERDGGRLRVGGSLWLGGSGEPPAAVRGDLVSIAGTIRVPDDPGFARSLRERGIVASVRASDVERLGGAPNPFVRAAQGFRALVGRSITSLYPAREAGLVLGLALGDDSRLDPAVERDFRATGLGHLLVVSGENVAMVLAPILALCAWLRVRPVTRFGVGLATVAFFVVLTGGEPSVLRAGVMAGIALVGVLLGRPRDGLALLASAALVLLVLDPFLARAVGFQLSVGATAGMVLLASPLADRLAFLPRGVALGLGATLAAQLFVTPLLLAVFREVPLVTVPANLLAAPAVSPALLFGLAAAAVGVVVPPLGHALAPLAILPSRFLIGLADVLARAPVAWITSGGGPLVFLVGTGISVLVALGIRRRLPRAAAAVGLAVLLAGSVASAVRAGPPDAFTVRFLDVGQGDATLLTTPGGATVLVDAGPDPDQVARELSALGVRRLDVAVATHPHADHVEGFASVLARFPVGLFLVPGCDDPSPTATDLARVLRDEHVTPVAVRPGDAFAVADLRLEVLSPDRCWEGSDSDPNNDSVVLVASVGASRVLLTGDVEKEAQRALLDRGADLRAAVLKVPHHGGATSLPEFLAAVGATIAVVSVGQPNDYGHPVEEVLDGMRAAGERVLRTDRLGTIVVTLSGPRVAVRWAA